MQEFFGPTALQRVKQYIFIQSFQFPWVFQVFLQCNGFFTTFHHFPPFPPSFSRCFFFFLRSPLLFPTAFLRFSADLGESNPTVTKLPSGTCPSKNSKTISQSLPNFEMFGLLGNVHPSHPLYSLRPRKQLCLAYRLAFVINYRNLLHFALCLATKS